MEEEKVQLPGVVEAFDTGIQVSAGHVFGNIDLTKSEGNAQIIGNSFVTFLTVFLSVCCDKNVPGAKELVANLNENFEGATFGKKPDGGE